MHASCLQVAMAARDYPLDLIHLLMCYSGGTNTSYITLLQWAANAKNILAVQPSSAAIQRVFSLRLGLHLMCRHSFKNIYNKNNFARIS